MYCVWFLPCLPYPDPLVEASGPASAPPTGPAPRSPLFSQTIEVWRGHRWELGFFRHFRPKFDRRLKATPLEALTSQAATSGNSTDRDVYGSGGRSKPGARRRKSGSSTECSGACALTWYEMIVTLGVKRGFCDFSACLDSDVSGPWEPFATAANGATKCSYGHARPVTDNAGADAIPACSAAFCRAGTSSSSAFPSVSGTDVTDEGEGGREGGAGGAGAGFGASPGGGAAAAGAFSTAIRGNWQRKATDTCLGREGALASTSMGGRHLVAPPQPLTAHAETSPCFLPFGSRPCSNVSSRQRQHHQLGQRPQRRHRRAQIWHFVSLASWLPTPHTAQCEGLASAH